MYGTSLPTLAAIFSEISSSAAAPKAFIIARITPAASALEPPKPAPEGIPVVIFMSAPPVQNVACVRSAAFMALEPLPSRFPSNVTVISSSFLGQTETTSKTLIDAITVSSM